jgi:hypothetical protein
MVRRHLPLLALVALLVALPAAAHKPSDGYLAIEHRGALLDVSVDLALRDLETAIGLDEDSNGEITWGELKRKRTDLEAYVLGRLRFSSGGERCALEARELQAIQHFDGAYAVLRLVGRCKTEAPVLVVDYRLLFDTDATHRGLVRYVAANGTTKSVVLTAASPEVSLSPTTSLVQQALAYVAQGTHHILQGIDHLLFLLSLLLPSVLIRRGAGWQPATSFRASLIDAAKIVTAFTVAHSITLSAAVLGIVALPSRLVESTIAFSIILAAVNNLHPLLRQGRVYAAFGFGLIHGFGFAGALRELGLPDEALAVSLASFNVGVELGQLAVVAVFLPLAFALRATSAYRLVALKAGSATIAAVALVWFVERAFDFAPGALALAFAR